MELYVDSFYTYVRPARSSPDYHVFYLIQGKILDLTGHGKHKEKSDKEGKKESKFRSKKNSLSSSASAMGGSDEMDSAEADLVAILANQVVKEENKKLRPGFRAKKKSNKAVIKKKISKFSYQLFLESSGAS